MLTTVQKNPRFSTNLIPAQVKALCVADLRLAAQNDPKGFARKVQSLADAGFSWSSIRDLRGLFAALAEPQVEVMAQLPVGQRAVQSSAFPVLSSILTVAGVNAAYAQVATIGQDLVTDFEDNKVETAFALIKSMENEQDSTPEGKPFPEIGASEESVRIGHKRNGRILRITAETIEENDVPGIVERINALGRIAANRIEEQTLDRIMDYDGSATSAAAPYVYRPNGAGTALYSATANTPGVRAPSGTRVTNNALADYTDLENARVRLSTMKDDLGKRIAIPMNDLYLVVPDALVSKSFQILNSEMTAGTVNEVNPWGPRGRWRPRLVSSPKLDDRSTTAWYFGDFKTQFKRKWKLRQEVVTMGQDNMDYLNSRIAFHARIAWDCEVGAIDYVFAVQCLSGTTSPKDD